MQKCVTSHEWSRRKLRIRHGFWGREIDSSPRHRPYVGGGRYVAPTTSDDTPRLHTFLRRACVQHSIMNPMRAVSKAFTSSFIASPEYQHFVLEVLLQGLLDPTIKLAPGEEGTGSRGQRWARKSAPACHPPSFGDKFPTPTSREQFRTEFVRGVKHICVSRQVCQIDSVVVGGTYTMVRKIPLRFNVFQ